MDPPSPRRSPSPADYITPEEAGIRAGVTPDYIRKLCTQGRIEGAKKWGRSWMIPAGAKVQMRQLRVSEIPRAKGSKRKTR
jgi:hypothetical protein